MPLLSRAVDRADQAARQSKSQRERIQDRDDDIVLLDEANGAAGNVDGLHELPQRILHQHDVGQFMGDSAPYFIAMPTSAKLSAGESLMPSPTMATSCRAAADPGSRRLVGRHHVGELPVGRAAPLTAWRPRALSPVSMIVLRMPKACRRDDHRPALGADLIRIGDESAELAVDRDIQAGARYRSSALRRPRPVDSRISYCRMKRSLPTWR